MARGAMRLIADVEANTTLPKTRARGRGWCAAGEESSMQEEIVLVFGTTSPETGPIYNPCDEARNGESWLIQSLIWAQLSVAG
jgi:hypothetical protein